MTQTGEDVPFVLAEADVIGPVDQLSLAMSADRKSLVVIAGGETKLTYTLPGPVIKGFQDAAFVSEIGDAFGGFLTMVAWRSMDDYADISCLFPTDAGSDFYARIANVAAMSLGESVLRWTMSPEEIAEAERLNAERAKASIEALLADLDPAEATAARAKFDEAAADLSHPEPPEVPC